MTDRINALVVVLDKNIRDDDVQPLVDAIMQLRNVCAVKLNVADIVEHVARSRVRLEFTNKLLEVLKND